MVIVIIDYQYQILRLHWDVDNDRVDAICYFIVRRTPIIIVSLLLWRLTGISCGPKETDSYFLTLPMILTIWLPSVISTAR